jgi:hypothetical protein
LKKILLGITLSLFAFQFSGKADPELPYSSLPLSSQIQIGRQIWPIDILTNILALPAKLILWNWKFSNHHITDKTKIQIREFTETNQLEALKVRVNAYDPVDDMRRLFKNKEVAIPIRMIAFPFVLINPFLGRFVGGIIVSDFYDPFTNTVHLYSDDPAIALHEGGHAADFAAQNYKGLYALGRILPFNALFQEQEATDRAIRFYQDQSKVDDELHAYKTLYPAYFSYIGGILPVYPVGYITAIFIGHFYGHSLANERKRLYEAVSPSPSEVIVRT